MKKLLLILILSLILSGNAYSNSDVVTAIEKCADAQFFGNEKGIPKSFYENHEEYKLAIKDKEIPQKNYDKYVVYFEATIQKYLEDNQRPKYPQQVTLSEYNFEDYRKAHAKFDNDLEKYLKQFTKELLTRREILKKQIEIIKETKRSLVAIHLKKLNLKDKAKTIQGYSTKFISCESTYNKTPKGFMLEWGF
jgi:hypothetical protein